MKKWCFLFYCLIIGIQSCKSSSDLDNPLPPVDATGAGAETLSYIYTAQTNGYACFRIPAIIRTKSGALLAFAEARKKNCADEGDIDLVLRRSTDGGKTWSNLVMVWDDAGNTCGNPAPVVDERTGAIHLLMTWNLGEDHIGEINNGTSKDTRRVFVTRSDDDGLTWAPAKEITAAVKKPEWGWYATGPCHGIQLAQGPHAGRMVIPCDYIEVGTKKGYSHVIYSDDAGATWQLGGATRQDKVNESTVAALSDGRLMLNMRSSNAVRMVSTSTDGGLTWTDIQPDYTLVDPVCQGSLLAHGAGAGHRLLFSNPASTTRTNMTVKMSADNGATWSKTYKVYSGPSAYSDLVMLPGEQLGILYEGGQAKPYEGIAFKIIALNDFK